MLKKIKNFDKYIKHHGIETVKFLFQDFDDYNPYPINYQQYQSFSDKTLLTLDEYFEKIRSELTRLINKVCNVRLVVNLVFRSIENFNDKRNIQIKSKSTTNINEIFSRLIKIHKTLSES